MLSKNGPELPTAYHRGFRSRQASSAEAQTPQDEQQCPGMVLAQAENQHLLHRPEQVGGPRSKADAREQAIR